MCAEEVTKREADLAAPPHLRGCRDWRSYRRLDLPDSRDSLVLSGNSLRNSCRRVIHRFVAETEFKRRNELLARFGLGIDGREMRSVRVLEVVPSVRGVPGGRPQRSIERYIPDTCRTKCIFDRCLRISRKLELLNSLLKQGRGKVRSHFSNGRPLSVES